jgi:hypothetical protein
MSPEQQGETYNRRDFMKLSGSALGGLALANAPRPAEAASLEPPSRDEAETIRLGFVGVGDRGSYHLDVALGIPGVEVPALCDIDRDYLYRAKRWVEEAGQPTPTLYGEDGNETDFKRLCAEEDLDAVICSTSWQWHTPVCLAAMRNDKHCVSEVPIVQTVEEAWELVETYEETGKWATLGLEQALLESGHGLSVLQMVQQGGLGDIIHAESGYVHDLRLVKFDPEREPWRLKHSIDRNGNLYPDHPLNKIMPCMDINHGDRFESIVSMSSGAQMLNEYAAHWYGEEHPYATMDMKQGDYNASLIRTVNGKLITLNFDTNTPHPRGQWRMQGSEGVYIEGDAIGEPKIYLDGISPESHEWEPAQPYLDEHRHPILDDYNPAERERPIRGHGGSGTQTPITWHLLVQNLRNDTMPYFDVYDSVTSSAISPLSEQSVAKNSQPVKVPDFTRGKWKERDQFTLQPPEKLAEAR